jgi:membrane-associated phospholipid phosphatase
VAKRAKAPLAASLACVAALIALAYLAYAVGPSERLDARLLGDLAVHGDTALGWPAEGLAHLGDPLSLLLMLAAACAVALWRGRPRGALAAVAVVAGANVTTQILKVLLAHPRYQPSLGAFQVRGNAFPSGHATAAASIAVACLFVAPSRLRGLVAVAGAGFYLAVGCSVLLLDWHYPSDVAAGLLVAGAWGFAVLAVLRAFDGRDPRPRRDYEERAAIAVK